MVLDVDLFLSRLLQAVGGGGNSARHNFSWGIRGAQIIAGEIKITGHSLVVQLGSLHSSKYTVLKTGLVFIGFIYKVSAAETSRVIDRGLLPLYPLQSLLQPVSVIDGKTMVVDSAIFVVIIRGTWYHTVMARPGMTGAPCSQMELASCCVAILRLVSRCVIAAS